MKYLLIFVLALVVGGHVYAYTQLQRLDEALALAKAEITTLSEQFDARSRELDESSAELDERIKTNSSNIDAVSSSNGEKIAAIVVRLDGLEDGLREGVMNQLTADIVKAATSEAIEKAVLADLPKSEPLLLAVGGVLAEHFRVELQGVPGEQVDPAVLASLLARNDTFIDSIRFELLEEIDAGE